MKRCPCCGKSNHRLRNCFKYKALQLQEEEEEEADAKLVIFIGSTIADNEMVQDTGATKHVTNNVHWLHNLSECNVKVLAYNGDANTSTATTQGVG